MKTYFYFLFPLIFLLLVFSCSHKAVLLVDGEEYSIDPPFGMVYVNKSLFADKYEVSNSDYVAFLTTIGVKHGWDSEVYQAFLPDTSVWKYQSINDSLKTTYKDLSKYGDYPVVGITYEQAQAYTKWRNTYWTESQLLQAKRIKPLESDTIQSAEFSLESYLDGSWPGIIDSTPIPLLIFSIPTQEEWYQLACFNENYIACSDADDEFNKHLLKKFGFLYNTKEFVNWRLANEENTSTMCPILPYRSMSVNIHGAFHTVGNVAEIIQPKGRVMGGSWNHSLDDLIILDESPVNLPNCWTGFRNVARYYVVYPGIVSPEPESLDRKTKN